MHNLHSPGNSITHINTTGVSFPWHHVHVHAYDSTSHYETVWFGRLCPPQVKLITKKPYGSSKFQNWFSATKVVSLSAWLWAVIEESRQRILFPVNWSTWCWYNMQMRLRKLQNTIPIYGKLRLIQVMVYIPRQCNQTHHGNEKCQPLQNWTVCCIMLPHHKTLHFHVEVTYLTKWGERVFPPSSVKVNRYLTRVIWYKSQGTVTREHKWSAEPLTSSHTRPYSVWNHLHYFHIRCTVYF